MRRMLIIFQLAAGGAERVVSRMANYWADTPNEVSVLTVESTRRDFYALDPRVERIALDLGQAPRSKAEASILHLRRLVALRRTLRKTRPDVAISFIDKMNLLTVAATRGLRMPVIVSERTDPTSYRLHFPMGRGLEAARRTLYRRASAVVVQTEGARGWALEFLARERTHVIPNPIDVIDQHTGASSEIELKAPAVISAGRMTPEKGFDLLLHAFARCSTAHPDWTLVILGNGPQRESLVTLADRLGISERVVFPGLVSGTLALFSRAQLFVLPSRAEGFPNALLEAMACGVASVSFDCPSGPADMIEDGVNGLLVPPENIEALAASMGRLMSDEDERVRLGAAATKVLERFSLSRVMAMWDELVSDVLASQP